MGLPFPDDLVDAAVLHQRRDLADHGLEGARAAPDLVEVDRQQDGVGAKPGGLHQPHGRAYAELACGIGRRRDDAAPDIVAQAREVGQRDLGQRQAGMRGQQRIVRAPASAAYDQRQALELRIAQQLDRREKGIHVEVGDAAGQGGGAHRGIVARPPASPRSRPLLKT